MSEVLLREEIRVEGLPAPVSHYVDAVRYGDLVFISGLAGVDGEGKLAGDDIASQTRQALVSMKKVLDRIGAGFGDILKVTVFMTDVREREAANAVRAEFFGSAFPASTLIGVTSLVVPQLKIEIEAVVGLPK